MLSRMNERLILFVWVFLIKWLVLIALKSALQLLLGMDKGLVNSILKDACNCIVNPEIIISKNITEYTLLFRKQTTKVSQPAAAL